MWCGCLHLSGYVLGRFPPSQHSGLDMPAGSSCTIHSSLPAPAFYLKLPVPRFMGFNHGVLQHSHTLGLPLLMQLVSFLHWNVLDCHDSSEKGTQIL